MTTTRATKSGSLKVAMAAVKEAHRLLALAATQLDLASCEDSGRTELICQIRDGACEQRDLVADLCDEVLALNE